MEFQEKLQAIYKKQNKIAPLIEGLEAEIPEQTLDDYYVKLNTIIKEDNDKKQANYEAISGQKKEVEIEDIFDQQDPASQAQTRRLLILGGAGVGKSTLMQYIAYRWATSGLWKEKFDFVYRVTLKILLNTGWDRDYTREERKDELKCLVHYNLAAQDEGLKLEEVPWLEKKDKILLLLDGYDEVAHERNGIYKKLFERIFEHENLILTSRPNAIDKQMAEKFGKKIENTGLDHHGINKYLTQYFKNDPDKGEELQEFLEKNISIKEICRIPVNIAMLCFIWSEGGSNEALHRISNMSDLYKQVVDHLGFRFYAKQQSNLQQNLDELMNRWKGGEIYLDELQALVYTAYKGMTGGGVEVPNDKRLQTLIIKGMTKKGDKDGISIQSSINYLRDKLKKDMPTINKVYKYGLLKPEGIVADRSNKKEPSETDLQEQSFSFIHLSFQEFLTALYLVQNLLKEETNKEEQEKIANFIAQHRNDPRYLMTLKLMAGILTSNDDRQAEQGLKIFWDAVLCNPDGVLELGMEAKVTLLMHLFAQAKKEDKIDARIPNVDTAVSFIDSVVLRDLTNWSSQIKESDYMSDNIKEGLIQYLVKNNAKWLSEISSKLQETHGFTNSASNHHPTNIEAVLDLTSSMINKFSQEEQNQIFLKSIQLINEHNENNWKWTKNAMEAVLNIHNKAKISLDKDQENRLFDTLLVTVYDDNLTQLSLKTIQELLNVSKKPELIEKVRIDVQQDFGNLKPEMQFTASKTKIQLLKIIQNPVDTQAVLNLVKTLAPLVENQDAQMYVTDYITDVVEISGSTDSHLIKYAITLLAPLLHNSDRNVEKRARSNIEKLVKLKGDDGPHLVKEVIESLRPRLQGHEESVIIFASSDMTDLMGISGNSHSQIILEIISGLIPTLQNFEFNRTNDNLVPRVLTRILYVKEKCAPKVDREIFNLLVPLLQHPQRDVRTLIVNNLSHFESTSTDPQLGTDVVNILIPLLKDSNQTTRERASWNIATTVNASQKTDPKLAPEVIQALTPFLKDSDPQMRILAFKTIGDIVGFCGDTQLVHEFVVNCLTPFFQDSDLTTLESAFGCSRKILSREKTPIDHEEVFKSFTHLLQSPDPTVRELTIQNLANIARSNLAYRRGDPKLAQAAINHLIRSIKDSDDDNEQIIMSIIPIVDRRSTFLYKEILDILTPFLKDKNVAIKKNSCKHNCTVASSRKCSGCHQYFKSTFTRS